MERFAASLALVVACTSPLLCEEVPHRPLSTSRFFTETPALNNPLGAHFPRAGQLEQVLRINRMIAEEAEAAGLDPRTAPADFYRDLLEQLNRRHRDLLASVPDLARQADRAGLAGSNDVEGLRRLAQALRTSPLREPLERFIIRSAHRARTRSQPSTFQDALRRARTMMENAGLSRDDLSGLQNVAARFINGWRSLGAFANETVGTAGELHVPFMVLPILVVVCAAGIAGAVILLRQRSRPAPPPPLPDFAALRPVATDFTGALLALYRRLAFEAGAPFRGKPLGELTHHAVQVHPALAAAAPRLNRAFYEMWYGKVDPPPEELASLTRELGDMAAVITRREGK